MLLRLEGLEVRYPGFKLGPLTLSFREGLHAILGPNGAGKTTLLKAVAGLVARRGRVLLDGRELGEAWMAVSANLAEPPSGFHATVYDYARLYVGRVTGSWERRVERVFEKLGVSWMIRRSFDELSEGQRSLALSLVAVARPSPILLLDEPFAHLDPFWRCRLLSLLRMEAAERIVVYTTHEFDTPRYADTVTLVKEGRIVSRGSPGEALGIQTLAECYNARFVTGGGCICLDCGADERRAIH